MAEESASTPTESSSAPTEAAEAPTANYNYAEGVAGAGDKPEWFKDSKYKTVSDQAQAYSELEAKLGGFTGKPDEYTLNEGIEVDNTTLLDGLKEIGTKYNMSNEMLNDLVSMQLKSEETALAEFKEREISNLGENGQARIDNINDWLGANVSEGLKEMLGNAAQTAEDIGFIEEFIKASKGQPLASAESVPSSSAYTQEGLNELQFATDERGNRKSRDPEYRAKVNAYAEKLQLSKK